MGSDVQKVEKCRADPGTGKAATIRIGTTTTGEPGTEATVENSGTETDAVFDFEIPRGTPGELDGIEDIPNTDIDSLGGGSKGLSLPYLSNAPDVWISMES